MATDGLLGSTDNNTIMVTLPQTLRIAKGTGTKVNTYINMDIIINLHIEVSIP
jgi:hypothetical protein